MLAKQCQTTPFEARINTKLTDQPKLLVFVSQKIYKICILFLYNIHICKKNKNCWLLFWQRLKIYIYFEGDTVTLREAIVNS